MSDVPFATNLLPQYQSPQQMDQMAATTANTQAGTALLGAQTQSASIQNQGAQLSLDALKQAYSNAPPTASSGQSSEIGQTGVGADDVTQHAISSFAPIPTAPPPALLNQSRLLALGGKPEAAKGILDNYAMQVTGANQQRQLAANNAYQSAETVASAPDGAAFETLQRVNPQAAEAIKQQYKDATPEELDQDVRTYAQHIGIATHQYSGRDTDFQNGVLVDKKDGKPVLGSQQVLTGLDAAGKEKAFASANELVTINNSDGSTSQVPRWQQAGFHSAEGYVVAADRNARSSAANPPPSSSGNTSATVAPPVKTQPPVAPAAVTADPQLKDALSDPDYKLKTPPLVAGRTPTPGELKQQDATVAARTDLLGNAQDTTNSGAQALQYLNAAKAIMDSKGAPVTGPLGGIVAKMTSAFGSVDSTNYQEAAKYLGNAAIQAGKGNFGKGMTQSDVQLQKDELSPSVHMTDAALKDLIDSGIKNTQYGVDSAKRVRPYLATGGDPQSFAEWNDKHFNRTATVNAPAKAPTPAAAAVQTATGPNGQKLYLRNGQWASQ